MIRNYSIRDSLPQIIYIFLALFCLLPFVTAPIALFAGLAIALTIGTPYRKFNKWASKYLLQVSVVGLGFGMNITDSLRAGQEGMISTLLSVTLVMFAGLFIGKKLGIGKTPSYLIASGTAICGGSAIAAVGPIAKANDSEMSVSLAVVFVLNAVALFIFPLIGHLAQLSEQQFGLWAAIAIHDTSSVVGAASVYGTDALQVGTMVKLTRALWIIPLSFFTMLFFKAKGSKISIPWFILFFVLAMIINTYFGIPDAFGSFAVGSSKKLLTLTLFFIGSGLTREGIKNVGTKPLLLGVLLWAIIGSVSFCTIYLAV